LKPDPAILKIVAIGPESTGKSTICEQLAVHYNTINCPEYAREYLLKHGMDYTFDNLLTIAKGQLNLEEGSIRQMEQIEAGAKDQKKRPLFIDTDMYVMKVWCEVVFEKCHRFILEEIVMRQYDLYLLCNVDLPWVKDELREYPDLAVRKKLYSVYLDCMINQEVPWVLISGDPESRLKIAIDAVDALISKKA
jgi:NadR type nicotinamide-nucleotide adenylyltransferase